MNSEISRNILGGLSQQPEDQRGPNQAKEAKNMFFDPVDGAGKRFPTNPVKVLSNTLQNQKHLLPMDRDDQQYLIWAGDSEINVYQTDGTEVPVVDSTNTGAGFVPKAATLTYLNGDRDTLRSQVIVDTAFILNTGVTVGREEYTSITPTWRLGAGGLAGQSNWGNVFIRQFNWSSTVKVRWKVTGGSLQEVIYSTPANRTSHSSAGTDLDATPYLRTTSYLIPYDSTIGGWKAERGSLVGVPANSEGINEEPLVDDSTQLFGHTAGNTNYSVCTYKSGDFVYDVATRVAKLAPGVAAYTGDMYFGWDFSGDPALSNSTARIRTSAKNTTAPTSYARSYPIRADYVAERLKEMIVAVGGIVGPAPAVGDNSGGAWFSIQAPDATPFEVFEVIDNTDGTYASGWTHTVEDVTDLPLNCRHGAVAKILGPEKDSGYYVAFQTEKFVREDKTVTADWAGTSQYGKGTWVEFVPGDAYPDASSPLPKDALTATTMPHIVRRITVTSAMMADGTFTGNWPDATLGSICFDVRPYDSWDSRLVGDDDNNEPPSFVDNTISDIFFWQSRLGFLSQDNIILSEANNPDNFWRTTQLSIPDSDRIDVAATENQGKNLRYAVPLDERLMVFSDDMQIVLTSNGLLSPNSVEAPVASQYQSLKNAPPILMGQSVIFPYKNHDYVGVREMVPLDNRDRFAAVGLTDWVTRWIQAGTSHKVVASTSEQLLFLHTDADPDALYVLSYVKDNEGSYKMAAWSNWDFPLDVLDFTLLDDALYVIFGNRNGETALERIDLGPGQEDPNVEHPSGDNYRFQLHIDRKYFWDGPSDTAVSAAFTADDGDGYTTFTFSEPNGMYRAEITSGLKAYAVDGTLIEEYDTGGPNPNGTNYKVVGNHTSGDVYFGVPYEMRWMANRVNPRIPSSGGSTARLSRRAINNSAVVGFDRTGYFDVSVSYHTGPSFTTTFNGDSSNNTSFGSFDQFDAVSPDPIRTGSIKVPIHGSSQNVRFLISSNSAYPCHITTIEWATQQNPKHGLKGVW